MSGTLYDAVPYPGYPFAQTHPDRLAAIAHLLGMHTAPVEHCRVLELACGDGGNLIPMALTLPGSTFVGIDLAAGAIAQGRETIAALGLRNIELREGDVATVDESWGAFDYILTHGLYSWAPAPVRDAVLRISSERLAANGVAYVSYNALPGARIRQMLREMMLFHAGEIEAPMERAQQARALLDLIAQGQAKPDAFTEMVRSEIERMTDRDLWALVHDELGEVYEPVYFHQFVEHAEQHGLQYLAGANFYDLQDAAITPDAQEVLSEIAEDDRVLRQQYADFIRCRRFHHTLLCHAGVALEWPVRAARVEGMFAVTAARPVAPHPDLAEGVEEEFRGPLDSGMKTGHPVAKALLMALIESAPQALSFEELVSRAGGVREDVAQILLATSMAGLTDLRTTRLPLVTEVSERPVASPLARYQAAHGEDLTSLNHATVRLAQDLERRLAVSLDGSRKRADLTVEEQTVAGNLARLGLLAG
jgi:SAM-dependent methyltransferase